MWDTFSASGDVGLKTWTSVASGLGASCKEQVTRIELKVVGLAPRLRREHMDCLRPNLFIQIHSVKP